MITAKVDLAIELLEDLLGIIQGVGQSLTRSRAALKYIALAISGHMDDVLTEYKVHSFFLLKRPAVLPSLELEWRRGAVATSVILSTLDPHMPLPPDIDLCKSSMPEIDQISLIVPNCPPHSCSAEDADGHFGSSDPSSLLCSYLQGFQAFIDGCETILVQNIELFGVHVLSERNQSTEFANSASPDDTMDNKKAQASVAQVQRRSTEYHENGENSKGVDSPHTVCIKEFCGALERLVSNLAPSIEGSWKWHLQLASRLSLSIAKCLLYAKCLKSIAEGETILVNQKKQCWQVASVMLDYMIKLPNILAWDNVLNVMSSAMKHLCSHAPRISWRLQTEIWLSILVSYGIEGLKNSENSLIDLFCTLLSHAEPEQRSVALQQLGRIIMSTTKVDYEYTTYKQNSLSSGSTVTSLLVTHTWDRVAALAFYDSSMLLRKHALALLTEYIPFVDRNHLQSFLGSSNSILNGVEQFSYAIEQGYLTRMSLLLLSRVVKELLTESTAKPVETDFKGIRESILQVLSSLSSVESYFEFFSTRSDQEYQELEEAEIELEIVKNEKARHSFIVHPQDTMIPDMSSYYKDGNEVNKQLQQIQEDIRERSKLREEIIARRQKKLLIRHTREKYLEETSSREMELLQELDRERAHEMEREIERQRQLDLERVKSRELQFNLDMEREKQTQRELQRELDQVELGRSSRREFSANTNSRSRERYRERDNGRGQQEGRSRGGGGVEAGGPATRSFSGNLPTILQQPRERTTSDERTSTGGNYYEENAEGSGDASSVGDPESAAALEAGTRAYSFSGQQVVVLNLNLNLKAGCSRTQGASRREMGEEAFLSRLWSNWLPVRTNCIDYLLVALYCTFLYYVCVRGAANENGYFDRWLRCSFSSLVFFTDICRTDKRCLFFTSNMSVLNATVQFYCL
uniref:Uncharacterized protein n=1 Tax=Oryza rufipogon TaxID=4529 RepID=A0A0E0P617_ORYRU